MPKESSINNNNHDDEEANKEIAMDITVESTVANTSQEGNITGSSSPSSVLKKTLTWKAVWTGRLIFVACLICVATVMGVVTWYFLTDAENEVAESQFEAIADRAIHTSQEIVVRKRLGTISMASVIANQFPFASDWPFVYMAGYEEVSTNIIDTSSGREMGLCPILVQSQLQAFEDHTNQSFFYDRVPPFPEGTGSSSFGHGIWKPDRSCECADNRSHVTSATVSWGSPFEIVTPILQHNMGPHRALQLNLHFEPTRGTIIDNLITCSGCQMSDDKSEIDCSNAPSHPNASLCGAVTDMLILTSQSSEPGPGALLMEPIYPARNNTHLVGLIASSIVWDESLRNVFSNDVSGVDCVLSTQHQTYTYGVTDGVPHLRGEGDLHNSDHDEFKQEIILTPTDLFSNTSAVYLLEVYPNDDFFDTYSTGNPRAATIGAVCIIVFTTLLFFMYDFCVRKEFDARKDLLEAKRRFVRFVSHEVRTPLNTVCMGLVLMQEEMAASMGLARPDQENRRLERADFEKKTVSGQSAFEWMSLSQEVLNNAQSSVDVLNDLLNYDKVQMGNLNLELSILSLWNLLESTVREFKLAALERKVNLGLDFSAIADLSLAVEANKGEVAALPLRTRAMRVVGDTVRLSQVIRNLVSNGLKFTPEDGNLTVRARIEELPDDKMVEKHFKLTSGRSVKLMREGLVYVDVVDTGVGMTEEQLATVFNDGTQFNVNKLQAGKGSGLGLYIAKGICKQHGGSLAVSSEGLGHGTTFTMHLPLYHLPMDPANFKSEQASSAYDGQEDFAAVTETYPLRILTVDDSAPNLKLLTRMLSNRGHTCEGAVNGEEALRMVQSHNLDFYDAILLDYEMPIMDGPTACSRMRKIGCSSFIVGITGNLLPEDIAHFKECGANAVLPKPFKMASLEELWSEYGVTGRMPNIEEETQTQLEQSPSREEEGTLTRSDSPNEGEAETKILLDGMDAVKSYEDNHNVSEEDRQSPRLGGQDEGDDQFKGAFVESSGLMDEPA